MKYLFLTTFLSLNLFAREINFSVKNKTVRKKITELTGITNEMLSDQASPQEILLKFQAIVFLQISNICGAIK